MKKAPVFIKDKVYIPAKYVDRDLMIDNYQRSLYEERNCNRCDNVQARHNYICDSCPSFIGTVKLWQDVDLKGRDYVSVPKGDLDHVAELFGIDWANDNIIDKRCYAPMTSRLKFIGKLYDGTPVNGIPTANQYEIVSQWMEKKNGIIQAAPRTGKTVSATYISLQLRLRTIITVHQPDLLKNFYKTYLNPDFTNLLKERKRTGRKIVHIVKKLSELDEEDYDVLLINYQKFNFGDVKAKLKKIIGNYGLFIGDELHAGAARYYAKFLAKLDCGYSCGLTATPSRKDDRFFIIEALIGPVTVVSYATGLKPKLEIWETGIESKYDYRTWLGYMRFLERSKERNEMIVKEVFEDLKTHPAIIILVEHLDHMQLLVDMINETYLRYKKKFKYIDDSEIDSLAIAYHGKCNREKVLKDSDEGKHRVLVAMHKLMKEGIDLYKPTMAYRTIPTSNLEMFYQSSNRVATPHAGKKQPVVKIMVDAISPSVACFKIIFSKEILPNLKGERQRYIMDAKTIARSFEILNKKKYASEKKIAKTRIGGRM